MIFLTEYVPATSTLLQCRPYAEEAREQANRERLELELGNLRRHLKHEVVLLEAANETVLHHTHGRYFKSLLEISQEMGELLPALQRKFESAQPSLDSPSP